MKKSVSDPAQEHIRRVRRMCAAMPGCTEKLSHGEPTFFARKKVFAIFSNNHHNDGHIAVLIPAEPGAQGVLIATAPETYYRPPYVGVRGWVGIELDSIGDDELAAHITDAWSLITTEKRAHKQPTRPIETGTTATSTNPRPRRRPATPTRGG